MNKTKWKIWCLLNKYIHRCQIHRYIFQFNIHWFCYHCSKSYRKTCAHPPIRNHLNTQRMKREKGKPVSTMWWPIENHSHLQVYLWFCYLKALKRDINKFDLTPYDNYNFDDNTQEARNYHKTISKVWLSIQNVVYEVSLIHIDNNEVYLKERKYQWENWIRNKNRKSENIDIFLQWQIGSTTTNRET